MEDPRRTIPVDIRIAEALEAGTLPKQLMCDSPAGCIAAETRLFDPTTGEHVPIGELHRCGIAPMVATLYGPRRASVPFVKGVAPLYRVTLETGQSFLGTADHLILTPAGWTHVGRVDIGDAALASRPIPLLSRPGADLSESPQDARRSLQIVQIVGGVVLAVIVLVMHDFGRK